MICRLDKRKHKSEKNWPVKHSSYINEFKEMVDTLQYLKEQRRLPVEHPHNDAAFNEYLVWLRPRTRLKLFSPAFYSADILEATNAGFDNLSNLEYNQRIRRVQR